MQSSCTQKKHSPHAKRNKCQQVNAMPPHPSNITRQHCLDIALHACRLPCMLEMVPVLAFTCMGCSPKRAPLSRGPGGGPGEKPGEKPWRRGPGGTAGGGAPAPSQPPTRWSYIATRLCQRHRLCCRFVFRVCCDFLKSLKSTLS